MNKKRVMVLSTCIMWGWLVFTGTCFSQESASGELKVEDDTVVLWNFDEGQGTIINDSGPIGINLQYFKRKDAKPNEGPPTWVRGKFGKALLFDAEQRQQYGNTKEAWKKSFGLAKEFTFEAWIKPEEKKIPKDYSIFQNMEYQKSGFRVVLTRNLEVGLLLENGTKEIMTRGKTKLMPGVWTHIACTYDGKAAKVYVNGVLDGQQEVPNAVIQSKFKGYTIGYTGGMPYFNGAIDSIRISKTARSKFNVK